MAVVKMTAKITGTRNAVDWPDVGETIELPDNEAESLIASRLAKPAKRDAHTLKAADHVDHSTDVIEANEAIRASGKPETADADEDDDAESTVLTTGRAGRSGR